MATIYSFPTQGHPRAPDTPREQGTPPVHHVRIKNLLNGLRENITDPDRDLEPEIAELVCYAMIEMLEQELADAGINLH
ncbi:MAG: hypothetical protein HUJ30_02435 [Gammaproteobacteria bacterium]|nr:hypothetical protein [Gammaproteobacteria bacterium]